jgi:hypothetical protein
MPRPGNGIGSGATVLQESSETMFSDVDEMVLEEITVSESVGIAATGSSTESEIATLAYQLWVDRGRPDGSDQEDWLRAEAMLKNAIASNRERLEKGSSIPPCDTRTDPEISLELRWEGHWEVWESEWGGARWTWDVVPPGVEFSNRAGGTDSMGNYQKECFR